MLHQVSSGSVHLTLLVSGQFCTPAGGRGWVTGVDGEEAGDEGDDGGDEPDDVHERNIRTALDKCWSYPLVNDV